MGCEWNVNVYEKYPHYFVPFLVCLPHFCPAWPPVWPTSVPPGPLSGPRLSRLAPCLDGVTRTECRMKR